MIEEMKKYGLKFVHQYKKGELKTVMRVSSDADIVEVFECFQRLLLAMTFSQSTIDQHIYELGQEIAANKTKETFHE